MPASSLPDHIRALQRRSAYPHQPDSVKLVQTHISYVFIAGDEVYKLKKPVDLGFVDFTTLEKRLQDCEAEVRLNRRGCASVYLGVEPVVARGRSYVIGGDGQPVDYAVHMKRLPAEGMMDAMLERGEVDFDTIGRLVARLVEFHRNAETSEEIRRAGGLNTLSDNWRENLQQVQPFAGRTLSARTFDRVQSYCEAFLREQSALLRRREREGRIRDCHGDLRSDAVCFSPDIPGGICIYDCIEFNDRFRYSDTGLDIAFLAMDLDFRGRAHLSDLLIGLYVPALGDPTLPLVLNFFKAYRAWTRGKVESLLLEDAAVPRGQKAEARRRAQTYFRLAESYALRSHPRRLVMVTGPSGSGKSVLAGVLAARLGGALLSTDMLRREQQDAGAAPEAVDTGRYAPEVRAEVYGRLVTEADAYLKDERPVVVDGTFLEREQRHPLIQAAQDLGVPLLLIECHAPDAVVEARQRRRAGETWTTSEGRFDVYLAQKQRYEPPAELPDEQRLVIDTTAPLQEQIAAVEERLRA